MNWRNILVYNLSSYDIFYSEDLPEEKLPKFESELNPQLTPLQKDFYFPPTLGGYNIERYLITKDGIIAPKGFPEKPTELKIVDEREFTIMDLVRGVKMALRYDLEIGDDLRKKWKEFLKVEFEPEFYQLLLLDSEEEVCEYIYAQIADLTSEEEREKVAGEIGKLCGRKIK